MNAKRKRIRITTEHREIFVIRGGHAKTVPGYCPACGVIVEMMGFDLAVSLSGLGSREMIRRSELGVIHTVEAATGHLLICKNSLETWGKYEELRHL